MKIIVLSTLVLALVLGPTWAGQAETFQLTSPAFQPGQPIDPKYTCDGKDISPPLAWTAPPAGTKSLALIMDDPDAPVGTWVHWVIYNIPAGESSLPEAVPADQELPSGARQGLNSWPKYGYGGPCPPSGQHRYFFKLYALDVSLDLPVKVTKDNLMQAMKDHILGQAELMGVYRRPGK